MSLRDTITRLLGGKVTTAAPYSVGARKGLRGCPEIAEREGPLIRLCALPKGHAAEHLPAKRPVKGHSTPPNFSPTVLPILTWPQTIVTDEDEP